MSRIRYKHQESMTKVEEIDSSTYREKNERIIANLDLPLKKNLDEVKKRIAILIREMLKKEKLA